MTLAFTIYESMLCGECRNPLSVCRDPKNAFEVTEDTCYARAAIDEHQKANAKSDPEPGQIISARLDDTPSVAVPPWLLG